MEPSDWAVVSVGAAVMSVGLANVAFFWKMLQQILAMSERIGGSSSASPTSRECSRWRCHGQIRLQR